MFTTGFKYWFGAATFALVAAFVYAVGTSDAGWMDRIVGPLSLGYKGSVGEHSGFAVLVGFAGTAMATAVLLVSWRDADPKSVAEVARTTEVPRPIPPQGASFWPVLGAFAAALVAMGVVVDAAFAVIGAALLVIAAVEWTIRTWSERVTIDPDANRELRSKLFFPVELPVIAALAIAVFVLAGSRILLAVDKTSSVIIAGVLATAIFAAAAALAARPSVNRTLLTGLLVVGGIGLLAGGVIAAASGEREFHHPTEEHAPGGDTEGEPADPAEHGTSEDLPSEHAAQDDGASALVAQP